jgi:hypothetical protein
MTKLSDYQKYTEDLKNQKKIDRKFQIRKAKFFYRLLEWSLTLTGLAVISYHTNPWVGFGIGLMLWGNLMRVSSYVLSPGSNSSKKLWRQKDE